MRWNQGRTEIDKLIADGELQRVPPNREHADQLFVQSRNGQPGGCAVGDPRHLLVGSQSATYCRLWPA